MLNSARGLNGCVSAPHTAAALAGQTVLAKGGTAIEAMVAAAATIASMAVPPLARTACPASAAAV